MKRILLSIVLCAFACAIYAQADKAAIKGAAAEATAAAARNAAAVPADSLKWKKGGNVSVNFAQTYLQNWAAGGEKSFSLSSVVNLFANYKKNKMIWENTTLLTYGIVKSGDRAAVKNTDQINMSSRTGYQMAKNWYYTAALLGRTQFAPGYRYSADTVRISNFLAPAYLYLSLGLDYKPSSKFFISFAPAMGKATYVRSDDPNMLISSGITQDLIDEGKHERYEFGGGLVLNINGSYFNKKVTYSSQLELFSNYFDKPQNLDVFWDFQFRVALTRFVSASVRLNMMYNDRLKTIKTITQPDGTKKQEEHGAQLQIKEFFEIGLFYAF